ncbi:uncharacterized protein LOC143285822 [Babylonia areolata]|uniref:uncharacterized protein LOC143285822 n=1 Tax=Babylonia areolata TaxID=304850 RepID=UPI003FD1BA9A
MNFVPPPYPDDVEEDFGPYSRDEIVVARASLLHSVQRENSMAWRNIKGKLGILPNGQRLRIYDPGHVWLPSNLPELWSAPVVLHDPTAPPEERTDEEPEDMRAEELEEDNCKERKDIPTGSKSDGSRAESRRSSSGDDVTDSSSKNSPKKRKREGRHHGDNETHSSAEDAGEGSSKRVKVGVSHSDSDREEGDQRYEVVFQCDVCNFNSQQQADTQQHLCRQGHYCASRYLAVREAGTGELCLTYLSVASLIKDAQHLCKEKVFACPECHSIFTSLHRCLSHTFQNHKLQGQYSLRLVTKSETFDLAKDTTVCSDCGAEVLDRDLTSHISETQHMGLHLGQKSSQSMMVFLCPFCQFIYHDLKSYKSHVFTKHAEEVPLSEALTVRCCTLGESQPAQTMPPKDPGIPLASIDFDFSQSPIPGDPGFRGASTKSKRRREQKRLQHLERQGQPSTMGKKKKKKANRKERLAAFKERMQKEKGQRKKN